MKQIAGYFISFLLMATVLTLGLVASATISKESIKQHLEESASYLTEDPTNFHYIVKGVDGSLRDQYADTVLLDIAYYINPEKPIDSLIWDRYYASPTEEFIYSLEEALKTDPSANSEYLRYWHGSLMIVRPLLMFINIRQIYTFNFVVLFVLLFWLILILIRNRFKQEAICLSAAMIAVNIWFVPCCLEYTWMFLVMVCASILAVRIALSKRYDKCGYLFLITGVVAAFLDFLTTETITLIIPILLIVRIHEKQTYHNAREAVTKNGYPQKLSAQDVRQKESTQSSGLMSFVVKSSALWATGFFFMWVLKWVLASAYLGKSVIPYIQGNALFQLGVDSFMPPYKLAVIGIWRNIKTLNPFGYGRIGSILFLVLVLLLIVIPVLRCKINIKLKINWRMVMVFILLGIMPYIRFLMLPFHTWHHFFFTYRAQASTILAIGFIILEVFERANLRLKDSKYQQSN